ncbi:hypothetical protein EBU99_02570 [bacterium]|nr:hypothetical protein [bacterium]
MTRSLTLMKTLFAVAVFLAVLVLTPIALSPVLFKNLQTNDQLQAPPQRMLVVFAHTDDEVTNSGLIRHFASLGTEIVLLTLTDGSANPKSDLNACQPDENITQCRIREVNASAEILGVKHVETPLLPDSALMEHLPQAVVNVSRLVNSFQPDAILTMEPSGLNGLADHQAAFLAVAGALKTLSQTPTLYLSKLPWPFSWFLKSKIPARFEKNTIVFPTDDTLLETKVAAALKHKSQASTIQGLTLGLGPRGLFRWINFETYSVHPTDDLTLLAGTYQFP